MIFLCVGCSWFQAEKTSPAELTRFVQSGKIVNESRLNRGGTLLIVPFDAGESVEANDVMDKVALRIIRGLLDVLENANHRFDIIYSEDKRDADLVLDGRITKLTQPSTLRKWVLFDKQRELEIEGFLKEVETGRTVLYFSDSKKTKSDEENHNILALQIGQDIGRFILSGLEYNQRSQE